MTIKTHTTHFDDCGCLSEVKDKEIEEQARLLGMSGSREAKLLSKIEELKTILREQGEYLSHDKNCAVCGFEAGEPTPDGGYRMKIRGKWYQSKPIDKTPKCNCGLLEIWEKTERVLGK